MAFSALALGCGDSSSSTQRVELSFAAVVGDEPFVCGEEYSNLGTTGASLVLSDFRFYVQDIELKNSAGAWVPVRLDENKFQNNNVALLDFEDGCGAMGNPDLNDSVLGSVPAGDYAGLRFKMGVPFEMNHVNSATAPSPLNVSTLFWNWQGGYKFLRIDSGQFSEANSNRVQVALDTFVVASNTVVANYAALVEDANLGEDLAADPGCMSKPPDTDCGPLFKNLGLPFGDSDGGMQQFFSAE
jgi:hypothetical protein